MITRKYIAKIGNLPLVQTSGTLESDILNITYPL